MSGCCGGNNHKRPKPEPKEVKKPKTEGGLINKIQKLVGLSKEK